MLDKNYFFLNIDFSILVKSENLLTKFSICYYFSSPVGFTLSFFPDFKNSFLFLLRSLFVRIVAFFSIASLISSSSIESIFITEHELLALSKHVRS